MRLLVVAAAFGKRTGNGGGETVSKVEMESGSG